MTDPQVSDAQVSNIDVGVDVGTSWTAVAVAQSRRVQMFHLGAHSAAMPTIAALDDNDALKVGYDALGATNDPTRITRNFKRRIGEEQPISLGPNEYHPQVLVARIVNHISELIERQHKNPPQNLVICHPANWGPYKQQLLKEALEQTPTPNITYITEPEAAAIAYTSRERLTEGTTLAVYDLGGGTFDTAVLQRTSQGFETLGEPKGIERLGGIDFDEAIYNHINTNLNGTLKDLDPNHPAHTEIRQLATRAKENLSTETQTTINATIDGASHNITLTRSEFENMIEPAIDDTIEALTDTINSTGLKPNQLDHILLVGGSSRIPLISNKITKHLNHTPTHDEHPKYSIPLGAAIRPLVGRMSAHAAQQARTQSTQEALPAPPTTASSSGSEVVIGAAGTAAAAAAMAGAGAAAGATDKPNAQHDDLVDRDELHTDPTAVVPASAAAAAGVPVTTDSSEPSDQNRNRLLGAAAALLLLLGGFFALKALTGDDGDDPDVLARSDTDGDLAVSGIDSTTSTTEASTTTRRTTTSTTQPASTSELTTTSARVSLDPTTTQAPQTTTPTTNPQQRDADGDGVTVADGDCNDQNPNIKPGAYDPPGDDIDQNCDGADTTPAGRQDRDGDGVTPDQGDCDDNNANIKPGANDPSGDGVDQNCDGNPNDPNDPNYQDNDGDGQSPNGGDCNDGDPSIYSGAPDNHGDGIDQDCNGSDGSPTSTTNQQQNSTSSSPGNVTTPSQRQ